MKMKFYITIAIALALLCLAEAAGRKKIVSNKKFADTKDPLNTTTDTLKASEKFGYPKKVTSLKKRPTKSSTIILTNSTNQSIDITKDSKDVTDIFKNLPADDFEFIKELDKQFKLHGNKLKIKVERDNTTNSSKNSKRTIEGELGYGYAHNGYTYDKPKFTFYPYSQKDIPPSAPSYYPQYETTSVTIEPSYSYELKPQTYLVQHTASQPQVDLPHPQEVEQVEHSDGQVHQQNVYQEPVIVLRIPGPTKYASHLQNLLQQYLEIRAAQYLRILQETESRKQHHNNHQYNQEINNHQQQHYEQEQQQPPPAQHVEAPSQDYALDVGFSHQEAPTPQPISYPAIDDVYQTYKERQQYQQPAAVEHHHQQHINGNSADQHNYAQLTEAHGPQQYYYPEEQQQIQTHSHSNDAYPQVYVIAMAPAVYSSDDHQLEQQQYDVPQQPIYVQEDEAHYTNQAYNHEQSGHLSTSENNPRPTHTKIIFTQSGEARNTDHSNTYPLPSIRPYERHEPATPTLYHQQYQQQQHSQADFDYQPAIVKSAAHQETVSITQRPFNYHAHSSKIRNRTGRKRATAGEVPTTTSAPASEASSQNVDETDQHLQKIRQYVHEKLGAQMGTAVEFKTTTVMKN